MSTDQPEGEASERTAIDHHYLAHDRAGETRAEAKVATAAVTAETPPERAEDGAEYQSGDTSVTTMPEVGGRVAEDATPVHSDETHRDEAHHDRAHHDDARHDAAGDDGGWTDDDVEPPAPAAKSSEVVATQAIPPKSVSDAKAAAKNDDLRLKKTDLLSEDSGWVKSEADNSAARTGSFADLKKSDPAAKITGSLKVSAARPQLARTQTDTESPRLVCIEGPDKGKEFVLGGRDVAIGRAPDNEVTLNDPSVSRLHCRILVDHGQYTVTDQRSGNGTIINGRKIDRAFLQSGATLKLGSSVLRFVEMGDVIKPSEAPARRPTPAPKPAKPPLGRQQRARRQAALIVAGALTVALVIIAASALRGRTLRRSAQDQAEESFAAGVLALRAKSFDEARENFHAAATLYAKDPRYLAHYNLVEKERTNAAGLASVRAFVQQDQLAQAKGALAGVNADTVFVADYVSAKDVLHDALLKKLEVLREGLARKPRALRELEPLAAELRPFEADDAGVRDALQSYDDMVARPPERAAEREVNEPASPERAPAATPAPSADAPRPGAAPKPPRRAADPAGTTTLAQRAMQAFIAGRLEEAEQMLASSSNDNDLALSNKMIKFEEVLAQAKSAVEGRQPTALAAVRKALAFESKIARGTSSYAAELNRLGATALVEQGSRAQAEQRPGDAYRAFKEALTMAPDHPLAKRRVQEISAQARDLFNQGYIAKDRDPAAAREKWKAVMAIVPPEDDLYQKAKQWLEHVK